MTTPAPRGYVGKMRKYQITIHVYGELGGHLEALAFADVPASAVGRRIQLEIARLLDGESITVDVAAQKEGK